MWYCNSQSLTSQLDFSLHKALLYLVSAKFFTLWSVIWSSPRGFYACEYIVFSSDSRAPSENMSRLDLQMLVSVWKYLCTSAARGGQIYLRKITGRDKKNPSTIFVCLAVLATKKSVPDVSEVGIWKLEILH